MIRQIVTRPSNNNEYFQIDERAPSPEAVLLKSSSTLENLGPSEEDDAEFAKELAKMVTESSAENRKVDKKTALAMWETAVPPPVLRKKRVDENDEDGVADAQNDEGVMKFTLFTKRGNKQQVQWTIWHLIRILLMFV